MKTIDDGMDAQPVDLRRRRVLTAVAAASCASVAGTLGALGAPSAAVAASGAQPAASLFSAQSLWNARPVNPRLGGTSIPADRNRAYLEQGAFGSRVFDGLSTDAAMTIAGATGNDGVWVSDELRKRPVVIPHFPAATLPATGSDGHCEIHDRTTNLIHSLYGLKYDTAARTWRAKKYTVTDAAGTGWGTPERPDGPRAAGVSTAGGLLRIHEAETLRVAHALAVALDASGLRSGPVYPATLEDRDGLTRYRGPIRLGTLLMLPHDFDESTLTMPHARAIAATLKTYGARVVDQTVGTFAIYGEIGSDWSQSTGTGGKWVASWQADLTRIRDTLREVAAADGWLDANGNAFEPRPWAEMNLLSMRGPWAVTGGASPATAPAAVAQAQAGFDTVRGMFVLPAGDRPLAYRKLLYLRDDATPGGWFRWQDAMRWYVNPAPRATYRIAASGFGEVAASVEIRTRDGAKSLVATRQLAIGESDQLRVPDDGAQLTAIHVSKPAGAAAGIRLDFVRVA